MLKIRIENLLDKVVIDMKLGDVCESVSLTFRRQQDKIILINTSDVLDGKVTNHEYVLNKNLRGQFKKSFQQQDILYSEIRPKNRRFAYIDFNADDYVASTKLMVIRANDKILPQFLFQVLKSDEIIDQLQLLAETRSGTFPQITFSELASLDVRIPPIPEQKGIAATLSCFDEKISNIAEKNHHLEQIAQAIFNELYFTGDLSILGDYLTDIESGSRPKGGALLSGIPSIGAENIERFGVYDYSKEKYISLDFFQRLQRGVVKSGDVLLYKDGAYTGKTSMALGGFPHQQCAINEHVFILRTNNKMPSQYFLYLLLRLDENREKLFTMASSKAAQPGLNQNEVKALQILIPNVKLIAKFNNEVEPLFKQIANNALENRRLAELRDTLLPKLMSGELSVSDIVGVK